MTFKAWTLRQFRFLRREEDTETDMWTKQVVFLCLVVCLFLAAVSLVTNPTNWVLVLSAVLTVVLLAYLVIVKKASHTLLAVFGLQMVLQVFWLDFRSAMLQRRRPWAFLVVIMDILLLSRCPGWISTCIAVTGAVAVSITEMELAWRFGLMDISGSPSYETRTEPFCADPLRPACDRPPCPSGLEDINWSLLSILIFVGDFLLTRSFAENVEVEKQKITRSIDVAHRFALLLADFNLEAASADLDSLAGCSDVPIGLLDVFQQLVHNLESYRPYLPQSCLQAKELTADQDVLIHVRGSTSTASCSAIDAERSSQSLSTSRVEPHDLPLSLFQRSISLLVSNTVDSERLLKTSPSEYVEVVDTHLSTIVSVVARHRGMVDFFIADKTYSVFNSVVRCPSHSQSAVRAAFELESAFPVVMNYGIAASTALCGVLGCASMKRFTTIGSAIRIAPHFERCGRALGKSIVVDSRTESDASAFCHFRLVPLRLFCRGHVLDDNLVKMLMYEAVSLIEENTTTDEWMYSLQSITNPAADYNSLALAYLQHNFDEAGFNPPPVEKDSSDPLLNTLISTIKARIPPRELTIG